MSEDKLKQQDTGNKIQVTLAVIALIGTLSGAIFSNWDKLFPSNKAGSPAFTSTPLLEAKNLEVNADSTKGTPFQNKENTHVQVQFEADPNDRWLAIPEDLSNSNIPEHAKGYLPPRGDLEFESNTTTCRVPLGALIVIGENRECKASGEAGSFELAPGETVYFLMNDVPGLYEDNRGSINVQVSLSRN